MPSAKSIGPPVGAVAGSKEYPLIRSSTPLWIGARLEAHILRVQETDGDLFLGIMIPGSDSWFSVRCGTHSDADHIGEVLTNIGKIIEELREFAKQLEKLPGMEEE